MDPADLDPAYAWLIAAALLGLAELFVPGVFLIWLAAAAGATGLAVLATGVPFAFQLVLFALFAILAVVLGRRWYVAHPVESSDPKLNDRTARLVGRTVEVVGDIAHGRGRVRVGDRVWDARGPDAAAGTRVRITGADGTCLNVEPLGPAAEIAQAGR